MRLDISNMLYQRILNKLLPFVRFWGEDASPQIKLEIFVVVEEVIPETQLDKYTDIATLGFIGGFIIMMMLDVALG